VISVLYFSNSLARGGTEEHILTLLRGLDRSRFRAAFVCTPEVAEAMRRDVPEDVELTPMRLRAPRHVGAARALRLLVRAHRVDVVHSHLFYASLFASPIAKLARVPLVVETPHVRESWRQGLKRHYVVDRVVGRFVDQYIAVSEANRRYLIEDKGLPAQKIVVIHNGCDLRRFRPHGRAPADMRRALGFADDDAVLVVVGRLEPQKGHRVLFDALPAIRRQFPGARVVCVGDGALRVELERQVAALGVTDAVRFVGQQPNVADWLALADATVLPSFYEGLPLAAIESLAAGRPMVATAVDGTPEVIVDGVTGLTVPPGNADELAQAICRLLADPWLSEKLAVAGRDRVLERFGAERQIRRTEALYELALARRRARRGHTSIRVAARSAR
jgi:glycosyltransferase involved in cell wall biosynthesis